MAVDVHALVKGRMRSPALRVQDTFTGEERIAVERC